MAQRLAEKVFLSLSGPDSLLGLWRLLSFSKQIWETQHVLGKNWVGLIMNSFNKINLFYIVFQCMTYILYF